MTLKADTE